MAIKISNSTIIDDSRNIVNAGIATLTSVSIGNTQVISSSRDLQNISSLNVTGVATVSSNLTVNGNTLYVDAINNRVGILTTSPSQPLQVGSGSSVVTIDSQGEIGIGTTNPTRRVQILGDSSTNQFNTALSIMNTNASGFGAYVGLNATSITSGRDWRLVSAGTSESAGVGNFSIYDGTALVNRFVINSSGNIGIRTTNPIQPIHFGSREDLVTVGIITNVTVGVTTTIISGITTTGLRTGYELLPVTNIISSGTTITGIGSTSINLGSATLNGTQQTGVTLTFAARNDGNVVVVTGIGSVGIGTTNPTSKLHLNGDINLDDGGTFTTTIQTITPTANRTVSVPDATGTLALVAGSSGQFIYNNAGANAGATGFTYNNVSQTLTVSAPSTTTSSPILNLSQTWNAGAVAFSGVTLNITDTASAATSLIEDWQVGGASRYQFVKSGLSYYYNTSTSSVNYERAKIGWESNILRVGTEKLGTGVARGLELQTDGTTRVAISTTGNVGINTTIPNSTLDVVGNANISGITTVGLGSTSSPTVNSTMSFELTNNTTLTVRVRGSDGVVRTGTISLV